MLPRGLKSILRISAPNDRVRPFLPHAAVEEPAEAAIAESGASSNAFYDESGTQHPDAKIDLEAMRERLRAISEEADKVAQNYQKQWAANPGRPIGKGPLTVPVPADSDDEEAALEDEG